MTTQPTPSMDPNAVLLTGENSFIALSDTPEGDVTTSASHWRIDFSPAGPGHVLFLRSELTENDWQVYADNIALARWLQGGIQGYLNPESGDQAIPVIEAEFERTGDTRVFWTEIVTAADEDVSLTWHDFGPPLLFHKIADKDARYGVCTVFVPAKGARVTLDGVHAGGKSWPRDNEGRSSSTSCLALSESWTQGPG